MWIVCIIGYNPLSQNASDLQSFKEDFQYKYCRTGADIHFSPKILVSSTSFAVFYTFLSQILPKPPNGP